MRFEARSDATFWLVEEDGSERAIDPQRVAEEYAAAAKRCRPKPLPPDVDLLTLRRSAEEQLRALTQIIATQGTGAGAIDPTR